GKPPFYPKTDAFVRRISGRLQILNPGEPWKGESGLNCRRAGSCDITLIQSGDVVAAGAGVCHCRHPVLRQSLLQFQKPLLVVSIGNVAGCERKDGDRRCGDTSKTGPCRLHSKRRGGWIGSKNRPQVERWELIDGKRLPWRRGIKDAESRPN